MKKNNSMRAAGGLMIATMLTTSIVSGTYAKYVTSDSATDTARVAKFGVTVEASGSLFDTSYENGDGTITVVSSTDEKVVAPGTKSDEALTFSISGKPEVSVNVAIDVVYEESTSDVFLKAGTYPDMTTGDPDDTFTLNADYHPIKYTLSKGSDKILNGGTMKDLKSALATAVNSNIGSNIELADTLGEYSITWEWAFEQGQDQADTLLGDLAAGTVNGIDAANYNLNTNIEFTVSVTQID